MSEAEKYLEMAEDSFADLQLLEEASDRAYWNSMYYSAFYAARAALLTLGFEPKTHSGTDTLVAKILFKDEEYIGREDAKHYSQLKTIREEKDYNPEANVNFEKEEMKQKTQKLLQKMKNIVEENQ
ncbi:MAG: HEPN domain-containing protein [Candidatus Nanohalobium sp.]